MSMELPTRKKRGGRPPIHEVKPGDRVALNVRVTPELKKWIDEAAWSSGRSQSQEVEFRLASTMEREQLLTDALVLRHGQQGAALLSAMSQALRLVEMLAGHTVVNEGGEWFAGRWLEDPRCFDAAEKALQLVLAGMHPTNPVATGWKGPFRREQPWEDTPLFAATAALAEPTQHRTVLPNKQRQAKKKGAAR
jgi:hypothetical protein